MHMFGESLDPHLASCLSGLHALGRKLPGSWFAGDASLAAGNVRQPPCDQGLGKFHRLDSNPGRTPGPTKKPVTRHVTRPETMFARQFPGEKKDRGREASYEPSQAGRRLLAPPLTRRRRPGGSRVGRWDVTSPSCSSGWPGRGQTVPACGKATDQPAGGYAVPPAAGTVPATVPLGLSCGRGRRGG